MYVLYFTKQAISSGTSKGGMRDVPPRPKFLYFHAVFGKNWSNSMLVPLWDWCPLLWEICHWSVPIGFTSSTYIHLNCIGLSNRSGWIQASISDGLFDLFNMNVIWYCKCIIGKGSVVQPVWYELMIKKKVLWPFQVCLLYVKLV